MKFRDYQQEAITQAFQWIREGRKRFIMQSPTGCHAAGQRVLVLTDNDSVVERRVEDIKAGTRLLGMNGETRTVLTLCRGRQQMAQVIPYDTGSKPFVVNVDHVLTLIDPVGRLKDITVAEWLEHPARQTLRLVRVPKTKSRLRCGTDVLIPMRFKVQLMMEDNYYGFTLDGDGRYLLDDYTITHNSGKTILGAHFMQRALAQNAKSLFVAHRVELLDQALKKLVESGTPRDQINVVLPGHRPDWTLPMHVGSIQSLMTKALNLCGGIRLTIIDEAHRSASPSYKKLFDHLPSATIIGLTATPCRLDNKPLDMYDDILVVAQPRQLIAGGYISEPTTWTVSEDELPDMTGVHTSGGDYVTSELEEAVNKRHLVGSIVRHWHARAEGMRTIVFATSVKHSKAIVEEFLASGVAAEHVDAETETGTRKGAIERLRSGETMVVSQVGLWIEGVDVPEAKCAILARPTRSLTMYLQAIGRIVRPYGGIKPLVLDHAGNAREHGLMSRDRTYSLYSNVPKREKSGLPPTWTCSACLMVNECTVEECVCGTAKPQRVRKQIRTVEGELVELSETQETRREYWDQLWMRAYSNGELPEWVTMKYRKRFGEEPPANWNPPDRPPVKHTYKDMLRDVYVFDSVASRQGLTIDWVRRKMNMKYNIECDPNMRPYEYVNSLDEQYMEDKRQRMTAWYTERNLPVPAPVKYGASTMIPEHNDKSIRFTESKVAPADSWEPISPAPTVVLPPGDDTFMTNEEEDMVF